MRRPARRSRKPPTCFTPSTRGRSWTRWPQSKHYSVTTSPAITRNGQPPAGIDEQFVSVLFSLKPGQATMQQTSTGFTVAVLSKVVDPTPEQDPADYAELTQSMTKLLQEDIGESFLDGLQQRDKVDVNQKLLSQLYQ